MKRWHRSPAALLITLTLGVALAALAACKAPDGAGSRSTQTATTPSATNAPAGPATAASQPQSQASPTGSPADGVARITVADARREAEAGRAVFVDVRTKAEFDRGHIKGAISLPKTEISARVGELPRNKTLIFYCA